jgi:hypothetical protein
MGRVSTLAFLFVALGGCKSSHQTEPDALVGSVPGAPTGVTAVAKAGGAFDVTWTAPTDSGSSPITGYSIESMPAGLSTMTTDTSFSTPMLALGTEYTLSVRAVNAVGSGPPAASNAVVAADIPAAPTDVVATAPSGRLAVSWTAADAHGDPITGYTVTVSPGGKTVQVAGNQTTTTIGGLTKGTMYSAVVTATNAFGTGPGASSNMITFTCSNNVYNICSVDSTVVQYGAPPLDVPQSQLEATRDLRAGTDQDLRGWVKYSLALVPAWAQVTSMTVYVKQATTSGGTSPVLELMYSQADSWNRAMIPTPTDIPVTTTISGTSAPGTSGTFQSFAVNVASHDWSSDLDAADGYLTIGIRNTATPAANDVSSVMYYSSDQSGTCTGNNPYIVLGVCE